MIPLCFGLIYQECSIWVFGLQVGIGNTRRDERFDVQMILNRIARWDSSKLKVLHHFELVAWILEFDTWPRAHQLRRGNYKSFW